MGGEADELDPQQQPDEVQMLAAYRGELGAEPNAFARLHGRAFLLMRRSGVTSGLAPPSRGMKTLIQRVPTAAFRDLPPSQYQVFPVRKTERSLIERFLTVGQTRNNDVVVRDVSVSKFHAYFQETDSGLVLQDARSTNGTFVNGMPVPRQGEGPAVPVSSGDRVRFGNVELSLLGAQEFLQLLEQVYASCATLRGVPRALACPLMLGWLLACAPGPRPAATPEPQKRPEPASPSAPAAAPGPPTATQPPEQGPASGPEPAPVESADAVSATEAVLALDPAHSTSLGSPGFGTLQGAVALPDAGPGFSHNPRRPHEARFGTVELVQTIVDAAAVVARELPGSELVVNDLCLEQGGPIAQHGSHQNGRDADILFYARRRDGTPRAAVGVPIEPDLSGVDFKDLSVAADDDRLWLDAPRTWRFVQAMLERSGDQVQRIFMVAHVRQALIDAARETAAPRAIVERFERVSCQPGSPHDDHMHVRFFCSPEDIAAGCVDQAPMHAFRRDWLAALGVAPVMETWRQRQQGARARKALTTSRGQARKTAERKYGRLHPEVRRFLERRETWAGKPSC